TVLMIFVPTSAPVSYHDVRFIFPDCVANGESTLLVERDFGVRIRKKHGLCPDQVSCFFGGCTLHFAVTLNRDVFRSSPFSQRETQQGPIPSALDLPG